MSTTAQLNPKIAIALAKLAEKIAAETGMKPTVDHLIHVAAWELLHSWDSTQPVKFE